MKPRMESRIDTGRKKNGRNSETIADLGLSETNLDDLEVQRPKPFIKPIKKSDVVFAGPRKKLFFKEPDPITHKNRLPDPANLSDTKINDSRKKRQEIKDKASIISFLNKNQQELTSNFNHINNKITTIKKTKPSPDTMEIIANLKPVTKRDAKSKSNTGIQVKIGNYLKEKSPGAEDLYTTKDLVRKESEDFIVNYSELVDVNLDETLKKIPLVTVQ